MTILLPIAVIAQGRLVAVHTGRVGQVARAAFARGRVLVLVAHVIGVVDIAILVGLALVVLTLVPNGVVSAIVGHTLALG